jgi:soluble lytic murein transglycosylase-like protein
MTRSLVSGLLVLALGSYSCDLSSLDATRATEPRYAQIPDTVIESRRLVPLGATPLPVEVRAVAETATGQARGFADLLASQRSGLSRREIEQVAIAMINEANARQLEPTLILAVVQVESGFDNFAVSPRGACGLMQILPATGEALAQELGIRWVGRRTLFDPVANVRIGVAYLQMLLRRYAGDLPTALAAYNSGPGRIDDFVRSGSRLPVGYSSRVLEQLRRGPGTRL